MSKKIRKKRSASRIKSQRTTILPKNKVEKIPIPAATLERKDDCSTNKPLAESAKTHSEPGSSNINIEIAVVLSNLRVPHHDEKAIQLCLMHTKDLNVGTVIFNGDEIDFHRRSDIDRNPMRIFSDKEMLILRQQIQEKIRAESKEDDEKDEEIEDYKVDERLVRNELLEQALRKELEQLFSIMKTFRDAHSNAELIWVYGCQEHYLALYLGKYFPRLVDEINDFCKQNRIQKVYNGTRNNTCNYGQLVIGHWHRGGLNSPSAYVAHALLDDEGVSLIQGHTNRGGWACRTVEGRRFISGYENFSLCKRPIGKNWQLGYSVVYREKNKKRFQVFQVPIANYGFFWGDKEYRLDPSRVGQWEKGVVISDIHRPFEDEEALYAVYDFLEEFQPDVLFVNGDACDFPDISRFSNSPIDILTDEDLKDLSALVVESNQKNIGVKFIKPRLQREFEKIYRLFKKLRELCPKARIIWILGNHEFRLQRYVEENAGHLAGVRRPGDKEEILSLADVTRVRELNIEVVFSGLIQSYTTYGGLLIGHFYKVCAKSAYTARNLLQQKQQSLVQPHVHRLGAHYKTNHDGKMMVAVEMGCLCRLDPQYMQNPNWQHGFVVIHRKKNSNRFYIQPIHIVDGAFLFGGKRYGRKSRRDENGSPKESNDSKEDKVVTPTNLKN